MTVSLVGWRRAALENGVMLEPPGERGLGLIQVRHRLPLRPVAAVVKQLLATPLGGVAPVQIGTPRQITTDEGEYGAMFELAARGEAREVRRTFGIVYGDDWMSTVDGRCAVAERFADYALLVERITASLALGLGSDRFRPAKYRPPGGWNGFQRFRCDVWLAPSYPQNPGMISVFHARPEADSGPGLQHHRLFEALTIEFGAQAGEPKPVQTRAGLAGHAITHHTAADRHAGTCVFGDGRHLYLARLETDLFNREANTAVFLRVVDSLQPLPLPRRELAGLVHWSE